MQAVKVEPTIHTEKYDLYLGDCLPIMRAMEPGSVDIIADPPYGIGETSVKNSTRSKMVSVKNYGEYFWDKKLSKYYIDAILALSKNTVLFGGNYYADWLPPSSSWIVWDKLNSGDFADCELAWTSHKKAVRKIAYMWNGCFKQKPEERFHPTQKPLDVMKWVVENYSSNSVLDPFMGSGTTGVACMKLGRRFIGIEIAQNYFEIAAKRIERAAAQMVMGI
jgi:site-specific DNA-methyltransferase (adenine-specific)/modification methylase